MAEHTVMVVEDNGLNRRLFADMLETSGFAVIACRGPREALEALEDERPALILTDIQLPEMSGLELTARIKADPRMADTPVVAVTAFALRNDEEKARLAGCDAYITKPVSMDRLIAVVRQFTQLTPRPGSPSAFPDGDG